MDFSCHSVMLFEPLILSSLLFLFAGWWALCTTCWAPRGTWARPRSCSRSLTPTLTAPSPRRSLLRSSSRIKASWMCYKENKRWSDCERKLKTSCPESLNASEMCDSNLIKEVWFDIYLSSINYMYHSMLTFLSAHSSLMNPLRHLADILIFCHNHWKV